MGQVAVDEELVRVGRAAASSRRDVLEVLDRVAVKIADRDLTAVDEGQDPEAGPDRLDDRVLDCV